LRETKSITNLSKITIFDANIKIRVTNLEKYATVIRALLTGPLKAGQTSEGGMPSA
jgi:hypothetical protein